MKSSSFFYSILMVFLMTGCMEPSNAPSSSEEFSVNLRTSEGVDLLDPSTEGAIDLSKTRLFLLENGETKWLHTKALEQFWTTLMALCQLRRMEYMG
jgi:hypothetical protein